MCIRIISLNLIRVSTNIEEPIHPSIKTQHHLPILDHLAESEIRDANISRMIYKDVLGFEIPIDETAFVQVLEHQSDLSCVESRKSFVELADFAQVTEHLAAIYERQDHVDVRVVLEAVLEIDYEREAYTSENVFLVVRWLDLYCIDDILVGS